MKEITGEIQNIKKDMKGLQINNIWYSSFKVLDSYEKGQTVKITYTENKGFNNIKDIELIDSTVKKESYNVSDTTVNTILMCSKEIYLNLFNKGTDIPLSEVTEDVIESYKLIRNNL